jgi:hypothetical protein
MPNNSTVLEIIGIDFSDYAIRDLSATLTPIVTGNLERTVNGNLVDMTLLSHRKYALTLDCTDHEAPELTGVFRGLDVTVKILPQLGVIDESTTTEDEPITLEMMVDSWQTGRKEWASETAWTLTLLEK